MSESRKKIVIEGPPISESDWVAKRFLGVDLASGPDIQAWHVADIDERGEVFMRPIQNERDLAWYRLKSRLRRGDITLLDPWPAKAPHS